MCHQNVGWKKRQKNVISYIKDVLIVTKEENLEVLESVLCKIQKTRFIINPVKAKMLQKKITYLGMELGKAVHGPDAQRVMIQEICFFSCSVPV